MGKIDTVLFSFSLIYLTLLFPTDEHHWWCLVREVSCVINFLNSKVESFSEKKQEFLEWMESAEFPSSLPSQERGQQAEDMWRCVVGALGVVQSTSSLAVSLLVVSQFGGTGCVRVAGF